MAREIVIDGKELINGATLGLLKPTFATVWNLGNGRVPETNIPNGTALVTRGVGAAATLGVLALIDRQYFIDGLWALGGASVAEVVLIVLGLLKSTSKD